MSFDVKTIEVFEKQAKRLVKKYPSLKKELFVLIEQLKQNPRHGTSLGNNCYKIRLRIASKRIGKSGGARIITTVVISERSVYLLSIYDKSERSTMTDSELKELLKYLPE